MISSHRKRTSRLRIELLEDRNLPTVQVLAALGEVAAGPGTPGFYVNDFEPNGLNNRGDVVYGADLSSVQGDPDSFFGEGVFLKNSGADAIRLAGAPDPAPGGGTFDPSLYYGPMTLNDLGDAAFTFQLTPLLANFDDPTAGKPFGVNAGTYRYSQTTGEVSPVLLPFETPAPGGGVFQGTVFYPHLNNRGDLLFDGLVETNKGIRGQGEKPTNLGVGIYKQDSSGDISSVVTAGDRGPDNRKFDYAAFPWSNDKGDIAFTGHIKGDRVSIPGFPPQNILISALTNIYVKDGTSGSITEIAHVGDEIPDSAGGGVFGGMLTPQINNRGDVIFTADLTQNFVNKPTEQLYFGLFRSSEGEIISIARRFDVMPGGDQLVTVSAFTGNQTNINNQGDIVFTATLDSDVNEDGVPDTGLYQWSEEGGLSVVVRTGTFIPGVGRVAGVTNPNSIVVGPAPGFFANGGAKNNDGGQVFTSVTLENGETVMLLITPDSPAASNSLTYAVSADIVSAGQGVNRLLTDGWVASSIVVHNSLTGTGSVGQGVTWQKPATEAIPTAPQQHATAKNDPADNVTPSSGTALNGSTAATEAQIDALFTLEELLPHGLKAKLL